MCLFLPSHSIHTTSLRQLLFTPLRPDCQPLGTLLPVDMQSASPSNQYLWKVVTNGPQGGESTLNTYKASVGISQVRWALGVSHLAFLLVSAKVHLHYNVCEVEIQPIHLAYIVSLELCKWLNRHNNLTNIQGCCAMLAITRFWFINTIFL